MANGTVEVADVSGNNVRIAVAVNSTANVVAVAAIGSTARAEASQSGTFVF